MNSVFVSVLTEADVGYVTDGPTLPIGMKFYEYYVIFQQGLSQLCWRVSFSVRGMPWWLMISVIILKILNIIS
jgi:hypothetical protein